ncbi:MAG: AIR synthase related protein, partial [Prolixibacteraceae bacterium]|nr:AIR synthase related protein [Prolixibacteraceae bacterium]
MNDRTKQNKPFSIDNVQDPENLEDIIFTLMVNPNLSTINYFNDFNDQVISSEALEDTGSEEGGIFILDDVGLCMAMTTHATHHHLFDDPKTAAQILVSRAARKMLCYGAQPIALSAFLYHIDYADPNGHFVSSEVKKGIEEVAKYYHLKITDKKVRFDNYLNQENVPATLIISMMGFAENKENVNLPVFKNKGNNIFVIGNSKDDINGSLYLEFYHNISNSPLPGFDVNESI